MNNNFGIGKQDNKAAFMQKMKDDKAKLANKTEQSKSAELLQRIMKGSLARIKLRKEIQADLEKNLNALETLSAHLFKTKQQVLKIPNAKVMFLVKSLIVMYSLKKDKPVLPPNVRQDDQYGGLTQVLAQRKQSQFELSRTQMIINLSKWVSRGMEAPEFSCINQIQWGKNTDEEILCKKFFELLLIELHQDNSSASLMNCISKFVHERGQVKEDSIKEILSIRLGSLAIKTKLMRQVRYWLFPKNIELHQTFESISNVKKQMVTKALKMAMQLFSEFKATSEKSYDFVIYLQYNFINEILSLPTIAKYLSPLIEKDEKLDCKRLFASFFYESQTDQSVQEKKNQDIQTRGGLLQEVKKSEKKMFIFANIFELLHKVLVHRMDTFEIYPVLQCLQATVHHLPKAIFDPNRSLVEDHILVLVLRNQVQAIMDFKTTNKVFGSIFGEKVDKKHSIFEDKFNPQAAIAITMIYSTIIMTSRMAPLLVQKIVLGLAFNEPVLYKLWRFIDVYCGIESLLVKNVSEFDQYHSFIHSLALFAIAFKHNMWVSSFEDFLKSDLFDREDIRKLVQLLKPLIVNLTEIQVSARKNKVQTSMLDEFVLSVGSALLRLPHEYFAVEGYIDPSEWDLNHIKWSNVMKDPAILLRDEIGMIIRYMPECIPFDVRAMFFTNRVKGDKELQSKIRHPVKIRRNMVWEDGFSKLCKIQNFKEQIYVVYINKYNQEEEGQDAGGLFKEFLVDLMEIVFNPNYGLFLQTENENQLYPNAASQSLFANDDTEVFRFLGRILGKAMYEGITVDPQFAQFFLRKLINKQNSLNDLKSLDAELFNSLMFLKNYKDGNIEDLEMYFCLDDKDEVTQKITEICLIPNGNQIKVTNQTKFRYIYLMADYRLNKRIKRQSDAFVAGFRDCIPLQWLGIFNERELQMLMSGSKQRIDVQDLRAHTKYIGGFSNSHKVIKWFWTFVEKGMDENDQSKLLRFVTSCPRQPLMGFGSMQPLFTISKLDTDGADTKLPTAATCFNVLRLPAYSSEKIMKEKILYAIHANAGFEMA